jgi:hypothetical protein
MTRNIGSRDIDRERDHRIKNAMPLSVMKDYQKVLEIVVASNIEKRAQGYTRFHDQTSMFVVHDMKLDILA